ncbi:MAG TPA: TonB-dependent receptor [Opitutus sp.]|nr:TonB-dependent receptor [Opitutus sp.]
MATTLLAPAAAQIAPAAGFVPANAPPVQLEAFEVSERGVTRANNVLHPADVAPTAATGASPLVVLNRLPGINLNTSTDFGIRTTDGEGLRLRAFTMAVLAVAVDGVPTSSANFFQRNPPTRFVDAENIASIVVSPGTGDVSTPSQTALGGSINFYTRAPGRTAALQADVTAGSRDLRRAFFRVDTGRQRNAWSATFGGSDTRQVPNFSAGDGPVDRRRKYDAQLQFESDHLLLNLALSHVQIDDVDDRPVSGALFGQWTSTASPAGDLSDDGRHWFYSRVDDGDPNGLASVNYAKNRNGVTETLVRLRTVVTPAPGLTITAVPYYQDRDAYHYGGVPYTTARSYYESAIRAQPGRTDIVAPLGYPTDLLAAPNTLPDGVTSLAAVDDPTDDKPHAREATTPGYRAGLPLSVEWRSGHQTLAAGLWFETEQSTSNRYLRRLQGGVITHPFDYSGYISVYFERESTLRIRQYFLEDTATLLDDRLALFAGAKAVRADYDFFGLPDNAYFDAGVTVHRTPSYADSFLPQLGATWRLNVADELFANFSRNFAAPDTTVIYGTTFDRAKLVGERADNLDLGLRINRGGFSASLAGYVIRYRNRIGDVTGYNALGFGLPYTATAFTNVGGVDGRGVEFAAAWRPTRDFSLNFAGAWQALAYADNYDEAVSATTTATRVIKGHTVPNTPAWTLNADAIWFHGAFYVAANARYQDGVFLTTQNQQRIPGHTLVGLGFGYDGIRRHGRLRHVRLACNIENLFDRHWFYATGASTGFANGSFFIGRPRACYLTVSTRF